MKNTYKNKKGSTLVMVIIIFAILSILGTTLYSIAVTNGKIGIMSSKIKRNFYFAESGLELAHNALIETIDEGIKQANNKGNNALMQINLEEERQKESNPEDDSLYIDSDGNIIDSEIRKQQQKDFEESYKVFLEKKVTNDPDDLKISTELDKKIGIISTEQSDESKDEKYNITAEYIKNDNKIDTVKLTSTYTKNEITQSVSAIYKLNDREFSGMYSYESKIVEVPDEDMLKNAISTDSNLIVRSTLANVVGDVFVDDDVILQSNNNDKNNKFSGNIYCNNFNIKTNNRKIGIDTLYTKDDLNINSKNSEIIIENYFGYGDGNTHDKSSAIVIGDMEKNKLTINDNLAILGTAFINTNPKKYQTGESISIKKNYKAYSQEFSEGDEDFKYYNPLVLLEAGLDEKINRFYSVAKQKESNLNLGQNIKLLVNNSMSRGVILNSDQVIKPNIPNEKDKNQIKTEANKLIGNLDQGVMKRLELLQNLVNIDYETNTGDKEIINGNIIKNEKSDFQGLMIASGNITLNSDFNFEGIMISGGSITVNKNLNFKGIMISGGNMVFNGELKSNGTVISSGNITFDNTSNIDVISNEDYVFKLLGQNEKLTKNLFIEDKDIEKKKIRAYEKLVPSDETNYDINSIIELDEWKVNYDK